MTELAMAPVSKMRTVWFAMLVRRRRKLRRTVSERTASRMRPTAPLTMDACSGIANGPNRTSRAGSTGPRAPTGGAAGRPNESAGGAEGSGGGADGSGGGAYAGSAGGAYTGSGGGAYSAGASGACTGGARGAYTNSRKVVGSIPASSEN
ncbi:hypothetical protein B0H11DRAFT_2205263 [Mycena galericulata]|nr:hypothetical protein B0H11DRAFT_2205263 [Mycena galericulata]